MRPSRVGTVRRMTHTTCNPIRRSRTSQPAGGRPGRLVSNRARARSIAFAASLTDARVEDPLPARRPHGGRHRAPRRQRLPDRDRARADHRQRQAGDRRDDGRRPRDERRSTPSNTPRSRKRPRSSCCGSNSAAAAAAIRALSDEQLAQAAPASLYADAPLTCQFVLEDHAVRHSYHHLARLRRVSAADRPTAKGVRS